MFEKIAKQLARYFGNSAMETMTESEVLNMLEDMPTIEATQANAGAIEVLTTTLAEFETRLAGITELTATVAQLQESLTTANATIAQLQTQLQEVSAAATLSQEAAAQVNADIQTLAADITAIKGTTTAVQSTDNPAPVPIGAAQPGQIKNDIIAQRLAGVKIGTFANRRNFQHN